MLAIIDSSDRRSVDAVIDPRVSQDPALRRKVGAIVAAVKREGDEALRRFANRYDGQSGALEMDTEAIAECAGQLKPAVRRAIATAARQIREVARAQRPRTVRVRVGEGVTVTERVVPLDRVGCYVPAGRYPLPSSLLMTAIPAAVAGVSEIVVVCPRPDPAICEAARVAGVTRLFRIGGAHAVAALAYGTKTVPRVDRIVGPGNRYVAAAKDLVSMDCAIDFHAGPSEIVVVTDSLDPEWVAADLLAQAEHDPDARAILVTTSRRYATRVAKAVTERLPATGPAAVSLYQHGAIIVAGSQAEAISLVNRIAPEHVLCADLETASKITRAGTIFVGELTVPAAGDYATGSNHVLPTAGAARFRGGLSAADFVRTISVQQVTRQGLSRLAPAITALARAEGLEAHALSVETRFAGKGR